MTKHDVLEYLNTLIRSPIEDPTQNGLVVIIGDK